MNKQTLPQGWTWSTLGEITNYGKTIKVEPYEIKPDEWVLELEDIEKDSSKLLKKTYNSERQSKSTKNSFEKGDVLYGKLRPYLNKVLLADESGVCSTEIIPLSAPADVDERYLFYSLKRPDFLEYVSSISHGLSMPRLGTKAGQDALIPLAPLKEQKRMADKLDVLLTLVESCREKLDRVPLILKSFRREVLAAATSGAMTVDWREKEGLSGWKTVSVQSVASKIFDGPFGSHLKSQDYTETGIRVVRLENIGWLKFYSEKETYISHEKFDSLKKHMLLAQDVLFSSFVSEDVRVCLLPDDFSGLTINKADCFCIRTNTSICSPGFLAMRLACRTTFAAFEAEVHGATRPRINLGQLKGYTFELPPINEQLEIVRRVEKLFAFADRLEARYVTARKLVEGLTPALLDKAFRGDLVLQDLNDEPAEMLLERLRVAKNSELLAPKSKNWRRKLIMMKITPETVKDAIHHLPKDRFSFDDLRKSLPGDYESLKEAVFILLSETAPSLQQYFDPEVQSMRFKWVK